ncbi:MAG TPA: GNAT family N-acetyltransferase [Methylomirabilota bacterium]|nr:GNAT family N-acetyltransferase [Methylomirabilota bacterium]
MAPSSIRLAQPSDLAQLALLRAALWPASSAEEHAAELAPILAGKSPGILPLAVSVAQAGDGTLLGFLEASLRSCADECDVAHPVGYIEGWYVVESARRQGIGAALLRAAESWARAQGCLEMASDAALDNLISQHAHEALGFQVASRAVLYRKSL